MRHSSMAQAGAMNGSANPAMSHFRSARMPEPSNYAHDPNLTKPITFVKAAKGLESTLDPEAKYEYGELQ